MRKKLFIFLIILLSFFMTTSFIQAISYKEYKVGDTYTYNGMDFYVIQDSDSDSEILTAIKAEPLTVKEVNAYKNTNHINVNTELSLGEAKNNNGYGYVTYYTNFDKCGYWAYEANSRVQISMHINNYKGCSLKYEESDIKYIIDAWVNDKISSKDMYYDEYGYKYRLLFNEDLSDNLGYKRNENGGYDKTANTPSFIYNSKYDYWIMHNYEFEDKISLNTSGNPLMINIDRSYINSSGEVKEFDGNYSTSNVTIFDMHAIRPVVNFRKSAINSSNNSVKALNTINFDVGDIIDYKGNKYYVISNNESAVTIIKTTPLTTEEVNKYGKGHINRYIAESKGKAYDLNGYGGVAYYSRRDCRDGYTSGCNSSYNASDIKYIIDAWAKDYTNSSDLVSTNGTRLINSDDLLQIGYDFFGTSTGSIGGGYNSLPQTLDFVLNLKDGWTSKSYQDSSSSVLTFAINGNLVSKKLYDYTSVVYPVITLKKVGYATANGNGYTIVNSPDTGVNKAYVLEITGLIILLSAITIYGYARVKKLV